MSRAPEEEPIMTRPGRPQGSQTRSLSLLFCVGCAGGCAAVGPFGEPGVGTNSAALVPNQPVIVTARIWGSQRNGFGQVVVQHEAGVAALQLDLERDNGDGTWTEVFPSWPFADADGETKLIDPV